MAPRSARKRKANDGDASAPSRRKKREDTPMKIGGVTGGVGEQPPSSADADTLSASLPLTLSNPKQQTEEAVPTHPQLSISFDPENSQVMGSLDDSPSGDVVENLLPLMLETQYEGDEDAEEQEGEMLAATGDENMPYSAADDDQEGLTMNEEAVAEETSAGDEDQVGQEDGADDEVRNSLVGASASIEEILQQLADVTYNFMTNYRELTSEGEAIQAELNQLNEAQDARCAKMLGRLERAGNSIFSFGQQQPGDDAIPCEDTQPGVAESQEMVV